DAAVQIVIGAHYRFARARGLPYRKTDGTGRTAGVRHDREIPVAVVHEQDVGDVLHPVAAGREQVLIHVIVEVDRHTAHRVTPTPPPRRRCRIHEDTV